MLSRHTKAARSGWSLPCREKLAIRSGGWPVQLTLNSGQHRLRCIERLPLLSRGGHFAAKADKTNGPRQCVSLRNIRLTRAHDW